MGEIKVLHELKLSFHFTSQIRLSLPWLLDVTQSLR